MKEVLQKLREFKTIQETNIKKGESIIDISYYGEITLSKNDTDISNQRKEDLYLVKKEIDGKIEFEFRIDFGIIAYIGEEGQIQIAEDFKQLINENEFLLQLKSIMPISLEKLEALEKSGSNKEIEKLSKTTENEKELEDEKKIEKEDSNTTKKYIENPKDAKIDLRKKITEKENFYDLVPEARQKGIVDLVVRRKDSTRFEFIGINGAGEEIKLKSLEQTEGTNPNKDIIEIDAKGTVKKDQVETIIKIKNGQNEGKQNEGFTVKLGEYGIPEVSYYRRARELNKYSSIPVNMENTNQKRTDRDVREYIEKTRNTATNDNIKRAEDRISYNEDNETQLENIDDNPYNDEIIDSAEIEIRKAAKRCKISVEEFKQKLETQDGDTLEEKIENAEEEINEEFRGLRDRG